MDPLAPMPLGLRGRFVDDVNGLRMHVLEAGEPGRPCLLLLHGFPELAWSWRHVMPALAEAGYYVVAPDQRGYGRTGPERVAYEAPFAPFRPFNLVRDALGLVWALGLRRVAAVVGHDFGSPIAAWCALLRPDVFPALALMSAPWAGAPPVPRDRTPRGDVHAALLALSPPREHYQWWYSRPDADADLLGAPAGLHAFLRAYYHVKSADWPGNRPRVLPRWTAEALATLPTYYVMEAGQGMAATVAPYHPDAAAVDACGWLPDPDLAVYAAEFARTGFQGGLNWYRCATSGAFTAEHELMAGRTIDVPATFIAGTQDWGVHQAPGALAAMETRACTRWHGTTLIEGAGHWVQQEQPEATVEALLRFLRGTE